MGRLPESDAGSAKRRLRNAERRLLGVMKHDEPRKQLLAAAERVRRAHLTLAQALDVALAYPTDVTDVDVLRQRANVAATRQQWNEMSADVIVALYAAKQPDP